MSLFNKYRYKYRKYKFDESYRPTFSVIVPAYNEVEVIERTIHSFLRTSYFSSKLELIIVNDASIDNTRKIVEKYAYKIIDSVTGKSEYIAENHKNITLVNRKTGGKGKSHVLNDGRLYANNEILLVIDADVKLSSNIFELASKHFSDERVGAVIGLVKVSPKKGSILNNFIDFECVIGQSLLRLGFDTIGLHYIISGGCGFFRKSIIDSVGKYDSDTLAEDTDMTWKLLTQTKTKIHFDSSIKVEADEPSLLNNLWNQRVRWSRGNFGVTLKYLDKVGNIKCGKAVTIGYPLWISTLFIPIILFITPFILVISSMFKLDISAISSIPRLIAITYISSLLLGIIVNKGHSWFAGLISCGIPSLFTFLSIIIWKNGFEGFLTTMGIQEYITLFNTIMFILLVMPMVFTPSIIKLSKKHRKLAEFIQFYIFGYWFIIITSSVYGYFKELRRDELTWIRTVR
jgi:cellulose synthase/poly-beta-1,6-N-acetylglucosamine synthase-like glycosyltransferase